VLEQKIKVIGKLKVRQNVANIIINMQSQLVEVQLKLINVPSIMFIT